MKKQTLLSEANKKRAAFKRFSQMGVTGLAVISMSAFTNLSANELPAFIENDSIKKQETLSVHILTDSLDDKNKARGFNDDDVAYTNATTTPAYCEYYNTHNYSNSNYTNNYSNGQNSNYTNNYTNTAY